MGRHNSGWDRQVPYEVSVNKYSVTIMFTDGTSETSEMWATDDGLDAYHSKVMSKGNAISISSRRIKEGIQKGEPFNPEWVGSEVVMEE